MPITRESQYAVRAVFELARRREDGLVKMVSIAEAQAIPERFLEVILARLRREGVIESKRGKMGGHRLIRQPSDLTVGEVLRVFDEDLVPVECMGGQDHRMCALKGDCPFAGIWEKARQSVTGIYDSTSFDDLLNRKI